MGKITENIPKQLVEIKGKPIIDYVISSIPNDLINKIYILTNYKSQMIENYIKTKYDKLKYIVIRINSTGTLDALRKMPDNISYRFLYLHGNIIFKRYLSRLLINKFPKKNCISISRKIQAPTHPMIQIKENKIDKVVIGAEKLRGVWYYSIGVAIINKKMLWSIKQIKKDAMMEEILIPSIEKGEKVEYYIYNDLWYHLQTTTDIAYIEKHIMKMFSDFK